MESRTIAGARRPPAHIISAGRAAAPPYDLDQVRSSAIASRVAARRSSLRIPYANLAQNRLGILNQVRRSAIPLLSRFSRTFKNF